MISTKNLVCLRRHHWKQKWLQKSESKPNLPKFQKQIYKRAGEALWIVVSQLESLVFNFPYGRQPNRLGHYFSMFREGGQIAPCIAASFVCSLNGVQISIFVLLDRNVRLLTLLGMQVE